MNKKKTIAFYVIVFAVFVYDYTFIFYSKTRDFVRKFLPKSKRNV